MDGIKAIGLLSGGLDSRLALKLVKEQGVEVIAVNFVTPFCTCTSKKMGCSSCRSAADQLGIELVVQGLGEEYFEIIEHPKFGHGRGLNPCIDCRILKLKKAGDLMKERDAKFLITGEVVGQRPMSQRRNTLLQIEKESGFPGLILRPLSARVLPETIPEQRGWVDRNKFLEITGRSRKVQIQLAEEKNIIDYPCPAGGCMLTQPEFAVKVKDLIVHNGKLNQNDVNLIKLGRHFRLSGSAKLVVGKNDSENKTIERLALDGDWLIQTDGIPGPLGLIRGGQASEQIALAGRLVAHYVNQSREDSVKLLAGRNGSEEKISLQAEKAGYEMVEQYRIKLKERKP